MNRLKGLGKYAEKVDALGKPWKRRMMRRLTDERFPLPYALRRTHRSKLHDSRIDGIGPAMIQSTSPGHRIGGIWGTQRPPSHSALSELPSYKPPGSNIENRIGPGAIARLASLP